MSLKFYFSFYLLLCALCLSISVKGEQLPLKLYTSADGLASGSIQHVSRDSRGFLWFSTRGGLSRFDGREFVNFRLENGDAAPNFNASLQTRDGVFWLSAAGGLYRAETDSANGEIQKENSGAKTNFFQIFKAEKVSNITPWLMFEDSRGRLWGIGTELILIAENGELKFERIDLGAIADGGRGAPVGAISEGRDGSLWLGCDTGAIRITPDGRRILYPIERQSGYDGTRSIIEDDAGRIWIAHSAGVFVFKPETLDVLNEIADSSRRESVIEEKIIENSETIALPADAGKMLRLRFGAPATENSVAGNQQTRDVYRIFKSSDGKLWLPTGDNLFVFDGETCRHLSDSNGFPGAINSVAEDAENNIWFVSDAGAVRFNPRGLTSWRLADGLSEPRVHSIFETTDGSLYIIHGAWRVSRITENGIVSGQLPMPDGDRFLWTSDVARLDSSKNWWAMSSNGFYRFAGTENLAALSAQKPERIFSQKDGFKSDSFYTAFEDSGYNLWISTRDTPEKSDLARLDAKTGELRFFSTADGLPIGFSPRAFAEDKVGNLWLGGYGGGLLRFRNGRFENFTDVENAPVGGIHALHIDDKGRLWIGSTRNGLSLVENPHVEDLSFKKYTTEQGLASENVRALTSDAQGNIYAGTIRGVDRLNPSTGAVRHFSTADGLSSDTVTTAFRDRRGRIWFGTFNGLSRLEPGGEAAETRSDLRVLINNLQIAGNDYTISEFGRERIENLDLAAAENNLRIQFTSVGDNLRFQYKLETGDDREWSRSTDERTVNFANLSPGDYKFFVRAVDSNNRTSENPAVISFSVAPPFWKTWKFIAAVILAAGLAVFLLDRFRVAKTHQVEAALAKSRMAEDSAKESETRFRTLAETASDAIITIDEQSRIIFVNPAVEKIFGYRAGELVGEKLTMLMPKKMRSGHDAGFGRYLRTSNKHIAWNGIELRGRHKSGLEMPIEVSFGEFERDGQRYFTGIIRDVSERRRAEEALQQAREDRIKELQRVRTRIATDLHDDIGSSLTQISVLTEVARASAVLESVKTPLERISNVSNELVDAMADIVWAINPKKDSLRELVLRMRRFASDVLPARDIEFELAAPKNLGDIAVGANIRREVFSIFKESINNIVRHSQATEVAIEFEVIVGVLRLEITDNGKGFDAAKILSRHFTPDKGGNGLVNIRRRVSELNGTCEITSSSAGTNIELHIPLQKEQEEISLAIRVDGDSGNNKRVN